MSDNLPPGVTAQDIDDHFGGEPDEYVVIGNISITFKTDGWDREDAEHRFAQAVKSNVGRELEVEHIEVIEVERA